MTLEEQLAEEERNGFVKQIADKLFQGIQKAYDTGENEKRRWIWELIQNAKDIKNQFGPVDIKITLTQDGLLFEHNDDPFTIKNLVGLLQQVSDKTQSPSEDTTGKFGTGFITTHMLSKVIIVDGLLDYGEAYKKFNFKLDRVAESSEELVDKVSILLKQKDDLSNNTLYPPLSKDEYVRSPECFETKFLYPLTETSIKYAKEGIDDLLNSGAYSLLFNKKIGRFIIEDHIREVNYTIKRKNTELIIGGINIFQAEIDNGIEPSTISLAYIIDEPNLTYIVVPVHLSVQNEIDEIVLLDRNTPTLFKEFPLIGTERWFFNFITNCNNFQPTEPRDGLRLHEEKDNPNKEAIVNKKYLESSTGKAIHFLTSLATLKKKPVKLFRLAESSLPKRENQNDVIDFLKGIQQTFRNEIKKLEIVQTTDGFKAIKDCRFPIISKLSYHDNETNLSFYQLCLAPFNSLVPIEDDYLEWHKIIKNEIESWGEELIVTLEDLLKEISTSNISKIKYGREDETTCEWLNTLYVFLDSNNYIDSYRNYALILNQRGNLIRASDAIKDEDSNIPELLKDIAEAFDLRYRDKLIDDRIKCKEVTGSLSISRIYQELNPIIAKQLTKSESAKQDQIVAVFSLCNIATHTNTESKIPIDEDRRINLVSHLSSLIPQWKTPPIQLPALKDFNFESALKVAIKYCLFQVSQSKNLTSLGVKLEFTEFDKAVLWIDKLIRLVAVHPELKVLLDDYPIFPNQKDDLCFRKDLSADIDLIDPELKDIHLALHPLKDIRKTLLRDGIDTSTVEKQYTLQNLASEINVTLQNNESKLNEPGYRVTALSMVNWLSQAKNKSKAIYFSWVDANKANIVLKSLDNHREPIFQILQSNTDFHKLAEIAKSKNFDVIAELVNIAPFELSQIKQIIDLANLSGGVDKLKEYAEDKIEEYNDAEFRRAIGEEVEKLFYTAFSQISDTFKVDREPYGQDYILRFPGLEYKVEIKSRAFGKGYVHMSITQGKTAVGTPDNYSLVVLERVAFTGTPSLEYFISNARFIMDIGHRLKSRIHVVNKIDEILTQNRQEENSVALDDMTYRFRIGKRVWDNPTAVSFTEFVDKIKERVSILLGTVNELRT